MLPGGTGPVIAAIVTRPTSLAELRRHAGAYGTRAAKVYVGTDEVPLEDYESIVLASGSRVAFMSSDRCPYVANDLQYRLQFPAIWEAPAVFPRQSRTRASILLLHSSGRYLFATRPNDVTPDVAAARFVGVERDSVDLIAPDGNALENCPYKGSDVRGVIALVERTDADKYVVFLDLRLLAEGIKFVVLPHPHLLDSDLPKLFTRKPPPPWALQVEGGDDGPDSSDPDSDSDEEDGHGDGASDATTRSRSRRFAGDFGEPWPYLPPADDDAPSPGLSAWGDSDSEEEAVTKQIPFFVLVPEYTPEQLAVTVTFPTTTADLLPLLQQARSLEQVERFPYVVAALPQTLHGTGVCVALPHWNSDAPIVCLDLVALDGRLFAALAPMYADRATLCDIADIPAAADVLVFVGISDVPLVGEAIAHIVPGLTVRFVQIEARRPQTPALPMLLLDHRAWSSAHTWVPPSAQGTYCLVSGHKYRRFFAEAEPFRYRQRLAQAVGAIDGRVHIAPAMPRAGDIEIDGTPCHTALAVAAHDPSLTAPQLVLVDCRALLEGWMCWPAYNHLLLLSDLMHDLRFSVPWGYDVAVSGAAQQGAHLLVHAGQVLVVEFVRRFAPAGAQAHIQSPSGTSGDSEQDGFVPSLDREDGVGNVHTRDAVAGTSDDDRTVDLRQTAVLQVLVAVPAYLSELYEVIPVFPQPDSRLDFASLLAIADLTADAQVKLFVRDTPWPVEQGVIIDVADGDLFTFVQLADPAPDRMALHDLLAAAADWGISTYLQALMRTMSG
ncbi:unnamed protein product [Symbiodinium microadriaticum]|nr:unnamed protein product [Symbiodinium microadriaticum]